MHFIMSLVEITYVFHCLTRVGSCIDFALMKQTYDINNIAAKCRTAQTHNVFILRKSGNIV